MNVSRADPARAAGLRRGRFEIGRAAFRGLSVLAAVVVMTATAAWAQTTVIQSDGSTLQTIEGASEQGTPPTGAVNAPISLAPVKAPQPLANENAAPPSGTILPLLQRPPDGQSGGQAGTQPSAVATPQPAKGIEVDTLADIELDSLGVLDSGDGGLGLETWNGSDRSVIERLLSRMPGKVSSPALRDLAVRLLLSSATAPIRLTLAAQAGQGGEVGGNSLLRHRLDRLAALGETAGLNTLLRAIPLRFDDEAVARLRVNGALLEGDLETACRLVQNGISLYHQSVYWAKALVFCQLANDQADQAMLGLDILRETESSDDPTLAALMAHVTGTQMPDLAGSAVTALDFAILRHFALPLPTDLARVADLGLAVALAQMESAPLEQRVMAAERAAAAGAADAALLGRVYDSFSFSPDELNSAISAAAERDGATGRALLYQSARQQPIAVARAEILRVMLAAAMAEGSYPALLPLLMPILAEVPAMPELDWFAETAARALYVGGRHELAAAWAGIARQAEVNAGEPGGMTIGIWPFERLAKATPQTAISDLASWRRGREDSGGGSAAAQQALLLLAFRALGESDSLSWAQVMLGQESVADASVAAAPLDSDALYALIDAGAAGRLGETVLLSVILLGENGPTASNRVALGAVLTMLAQVGLDREARALAMEAAVGSGI